MRDLPTAQDRDNGGDDDDGTKRHSYDAAGGMGDQRYTWPLQPAPNTKSR
jgi:hypothetical protein